MRYTEYHCGTAVIKDRELLPEALAKLARYEDAEEAGKLVKLPCALGDTAYWISDEDKEGNRVPTVRETKPIKGIAIEADGFYIRTETEQEQGYDKIGDRLAYLTKEAAQAAAEKLKGGGRDE